jgi:hypothetical protein
MPAAAVESRTPAISGMSGKFEGASGDTADAMASSPAPAHAGVQPHQTNRHYPVNRAMPIFADRAASGSTRPDRRAGELRFRLFLRLGRLVQSLDLGVGA